MVKHCISSSTKFENVVSEILRKITFSNYACTITPIGLVSYLVKTFSSLLVVLDHTIAGNLLLTGDLNIAKGKTEELTIKDRHMTWSHPGISPTETLTQSSQA